MITTIPFAGFYYSWHSEEIDREVEQLISDSSGCHPISERLKDEIFDGINYQEAYIEYAKEWVNYFSHWFANEFNGVKLQYESMSSPKEYNFQTDRLFCKITHKDAIKLYKLVNRENLKTIATKRFTSRDGFISFYSPDVKQWGPLRIWDHNQLGTLVEAAILQYENDSDEWEMAILDRMFGNGVASNAVYSALNNKGKRIVKIADYLREREERKFRAA